MALERRPIIPGFVHLGLFLINFPVAFNWVTDLLLINVLSVFASLGIPVIGLCLAIAVLRYRLFDIDVIIRKTLVYAVLTAVLALVFFGVVVVLQAVFGRLIGRATDEQSPLVIVISTLIIAALSSPLRRRVQAVIDWRFFRQKYNAQQVLAHFAVTARDETNLDLLTSELARVVQETMQPESVSIWLK